MSESDVAAWLDANLRRKADEFGLVDWAVRWESADIEDGYAECRCLPDYQRVCIGVCLGKFAALEQLERTVEHELLHACAMHTYRACRVLVLKSSMTEPEVEMFWEALEAAFERDCRQLEKLVEALRGQGR